VNPDLPIKNESQIGYQILAYLVEHPEAQDSLEGIVEWWLLERQIQYQTSKVKEALSELIAKGWVIAQKGLKSQTHYRINQSKYEELQKLFKNKKN